MSEEQEKALNYPRLKADIELCRELISSACHGKWRMRVPPDTKDHDMHLSAAIDELEALRAKLKKVETERDALDALVEALERQADFTAQSARFALDSSWENEQYRGICQTTQSARAELDAVREAGNG